MTATAGHGRLGRRVWRRALAAVSLLVAASRCMALDGFLYVPTPAAADADLFAGTAIPTALRRDADGAVRTTDGVTVDAYLLAHAPGDGTQTAHHGTWVLYCHGNNRNLAAFARRIEAIWQLGYTVVAFDYRGYGKTPGSPTEAGLYRDARAVRAWAHAQGATDATLALYGYSLGAAVCSQLAIEAPTPLLVLESPFASIDQLTHDASGVGLPRSFFTHAQYDTLHKLPQHRGDLLIYHGARDAYLRPAYGRMLADAAEGHARSVDFVLVPGADHETTPCRSKTLGRTPPGDCAEGFDPAYLATLSAALDAAIEPRTAATP